jgi:hypothetical protein
MKPCNLALPTSGNLNTLVEHPNKFIFLHFKKNYLIALKQNIGHAGVEHHSRSMQIFDHHYNKNV